MTRRIRGRPKVVVATFWKALDSGRQPVREWLLELAAGDRKNLGGDIHRVETDWPNVGLPLVRALGGRLFEVRCNLPGRIARVIFAVDEGRMVLLHGFIKKTQGDRTARPRSGEGSLANVANSAEVRASCRKEQIRIREVLWSLC
jgi:phage-related protein